MKRLFIISIFFNVVFFNSLHAGFSDNSGNPSLEDLLANTQKEAAVATKRKQEEVDRAEHTLLQKLEEAEGLQTIGDARAFVFQHAPLPLSQQTRALFMTPPFLLYKFIDWVTPPVEQKEGLVGFFANNTGDGLEKKNKRWGQVLAQTSLGTAFYSMALLTWYWWTYTNRQRRFIVDNLQCKNCLSELATSTMKEGLFSDEKGHTCATQALARLRNSTKMCEIHKKKLLPPSTVKIEAQPQNDSASSALENRYEVLVKIKKR